MHIYNTGKKHLAVDLKAEGCVVAIGNFDGVHLGHRAVIDRAVSMAQKLRCPAAVMTLEPYPAEYFKPDSAPARLSSRRHKIELLASTEVDYIIAVRFNQELAKTSAEDFVRKHLYERLAVRHIVIGEDFHFGARRTGNVSVLRKLGEELDFTVSAVNDYSKNGKRVSSTQIRELLSEGQLSAANKLLGREFSWKSRVVHGDKRGRTWGFPTANIVIPTLSFPIGGVFIVRVEEKGTLVGYGVTNVGSRPTVGVTRLLIETHLFSSSIDLYGRLLNVVFLKKIRDEKKFPDFDALRQQIMLDVQFGKQWVNEEIEVE